MEGLMINYSHVQLFSKKALVLLLDHISQKAKLYLEDDHLIATAIETQKVKKLFDLKRVGEDFLFAVNESKRLMVLVSKPDVSQI
jgi:hypothetical protein